MPIYKFKNMCYITYEINFKEGISWLTHKNQFRSLSVYAQ